VPCTSSVNLNSVNKYSGMVIGWASNSLCYKSKLQIIISELVVLFDQYSDLLSVNHLKKSEHNIS
jgi:hypothetical protein